MEFESILSEPQPNVLTINTIATVFSSRVELELPESKSGVVAITLRENKAHRTRFEQVLKISFYSFGDCCICHLC